MLSVGMYYVLESDEVLAVKSLETSKTSSYNIVIEQVQADFQWLCWYFSVEDSRYIPVHLLHDKRIGKFCGGAFTRFTDGTFFIAINWKLVYNELSRKILLETIAHEVAHLFVHLYFQEEAKIDGDCHGKIWQEISGILGNNPASHSYLDGKIWDSLDEMNIESLEK